jgi:Helix-loop-helix DNA-binding domain
METSSEQQLQQPSTHQEAPSAMQQALQTFQANADAQTLQIASDTVTSTSNVAQLQQQPLNQQQLQALQQQFLPVFPVPKVASIPPTDATTAQQQLLWQQALQTLVVVPPFAAAAVAGQTPFLASLTFPHLMQYNLQQQQAPQIQMPYSMPTNNKHSSVDTSSEKKRSRKQQKRSPREAGPSVVSLNGSSGSNNSSQLIDGMDNLQPPTEKSASDVQKMTAAERRRYERNLREQQRSYRISQQIKQLRDVLQESNVPFRPNKYSILVSVAEYIQELQSRSIMLDSEHQRLIDTIKRTTEMGTSTGGSTAALSNMNVAEGNSVASKPHATDDVYSDSLLVQGIDYQSVFHHCPYPLGVATLDGRLLASNQEFEKLLNADGNCSMTDKSFFVYIRNHQEIFEAMAALLKRSTATIETGKGTITEARELLFWCGHVVTPRNEKVRVIHRWSSLFSNTRTLI